MPSDTHVSVCIALRFIDFSADFMQQRLLRQQTNRRSTRKVMANIIFYFLLMAGILSGSAMAQAPGNDASSLVAHPVTRSSFPSSVSYPNLPNTCDITSGCFYSNVSNFQCGDSEIAITSTCISNDQTNSDPYCFFQNIAFVNPILKQTKSFNYSYETDNQKHVSGARCIKTSAGFYVELENTNLGNCKTCEWNDYFDEKGEYLGSEKGMYGSTSFVRKFLPLRKKEVIQKGELVRSIDITTIAQ